MPSNDEIQRIATAMNALRPDWKHSSLVTFLGRHHATRAYRDLAIAAVVVASDPTTKTPELLNKHGNWWAAAQAASGSVATTVPRPDDPRCTEPGHEHELARNCRACRSEALATDGRTETPLRLTPEQAARNTRWAEQIRTLDRAQLASGERPEED